LNSPPLKIERIFKKVPLPINKKAIYLCVLLTWNIEKAIAKATVTPAIRLAVLEKTDKATSMMIKPIKTDKKFSPLDLARFFIY
jgi:hypothetical protein